MMNNQINNNFSNLTLVIPAKEETNCLYQVLNEIKDFELKKIVIIPSDHSIPTNYPFKDLKIINQKKRGYGNAIIEGIDKVNTEFFCIFNADGSFNPLELKGMNGNSNYYDFVFGSRYLKNSKSDDDTFLTIIGNYIFSKIGQIFFNIKLSDILYTYILGNTSKFKQLNVKSGDFGFCVELPIKLSRTNFSYTELPSHERKRISGIKNVNEFVDGFKILLKMIKLFFNKKITN